MDYNNSGNLIKFIIVYVLVICLKIEGELCAKCSYHESNIYIYIEELFLVIFYLGINTTSAN